VTTAFTAAIILVAMTAAPSEPALKEAGNPHGVARSRADAPASAAAAARLVADLASVDEKVQTEARKRLAALGEAAVAPLMKVLGDAAAPQPHRLAAAETLAAVGRPAQAALIGTLKHADTFVRATAARTLGLTGDVQAVGAVLDALRDKEPAVREKAAWALGQLGNAAALLDLIAALRTDPSLDVRTTAADALGRLGCRAAIEPLIEGLEDEQPPIRAASAKALGLMGPLLASGARGELGRKKAVAALLAALADKHGTVRADAAEALGLMRERTAAESLANLLADADLRMVAIEALGRIDERAALRALEKVAADTKDESLRGAAEAAAGFLRSSQRDGHRKQGVATPHIL